MSDFESEINAEAERLAMHAKLVAAANKLRNAYNSQAEFLAAVLPILDKHGGGATKLAEVAAEYQAAVLRMLEAEYEARGGDEANVIDPDAANAPMSKQTFKWVQANWVWVIGAKRFVRLRDAEVWDVKQMDSCYNHLTQKTSFSNALFASNSIRKAERIVFRPNARLLIENGRSLNFWRPSPIVPKAGDTTIWNEHLDYLFPDPADRDRVVKLLAWAYRNQHLRTQLALLIIGRQTGTGKSFIARVAEQLFGPENTQRPKNTSIKGEFNGWALKCKLCIIEELMQVGRRDVVNALNPIITEPTIEANEKFLPAQKVANLMFMIANSNHRDALPLSRFDRRWLVVGAADEKNTPEYYKRLFTILEGPNSRDLLSAIAWELKTMDIGDYDPRVGVDDKSAAKADMIDAALPPITRWMREEHRLGNYPFNLKLVNTTDDIMTAMPPWVLSEKRDGKSLETLVGDFLRDDLKGDNFGSIAHRIGVGRKAPFRTLWGINGGQQEYAKVERSERARAYLEEKRLKGPNGPFGNDEQTNESDIDPVTGEPWEQE